MVERSGIEGIFTHLTGREKELLTELAAAAPAAATVVEVGSYLGASTCFLAAGLRGADGRVYAVDTWTNLAMSEGARDTYAEFLANTAPFRDVIVPLRGLSAEVAPDFRKQIDLLFVDGDHTYDGVRSDLDAWLPKVRDGGAVVFHDFNWSEGVRRAVREFVLPRQTGGGRRLDSIYWARIGSRPPRVEGGPRASVIVPTAGRAEDVAPTIESLLAQDYPAEAYEVLVVDNTRAGDLAPGLAARFASAPNLSLLPERIPGLLAGRHLGAARARGAILSFVDDDVVADPGWLRAVVEAFDDETVHLVGGRCLPRYEVEPPAWLARFWRPHEFGTWCAHLSLLDFGAEARDVDPGYVWGLNFSIRKDMLVALGGFHPDGMPWSLRRYRGDGETALAERARELGLRARYVPGAVVHHRVPAERLSCEYFERRAHLQGISDSYAEIRARGTATDPHGRRRRGKVRTLVRRVRRRARAWLGKPFGAAEDRVELRVAEAYEAGRAFHEAEVERDAGLLAWVLRDEYWDYSLPP